MGYNIVVLVKQVPDTKNITGKAMTESGTVNRAGMERIFNPEDLNALEMALEVKERHGGEITVITMGPPFASEVLREALYRGADKVALLSDRRFGVADTLATSYTLSQAITAKTPEYDLIFCGRQAIDGDTAQVGPQVAEKLGIPQVTYGECIERLSGDEIQIRREIGGGYEQVVVKLPLLVTVTGEANTPRPPRAKLILKYKNASTKLDLPELREEFPECEQEAELEDYLKSRGLLIPLWTPEDIGAELDRIGLVGSPTKVKRTFSVVLTATASKEVEPTDVGIREMIDELIEDHILG